MYAWSFQACIDSEHNALRFSHASIRRESAQNVESIIFIFHPLIVSNQEGAPPLALSHWYHNDNAMAWSIARNLRNFGLIIYIFFGLSLIELFLPPFTSYHSRNEWLHKLNIFQSFEK